MAGDNNQGQGQDWDGAEGEPLETERLALESEEERLPWLESSDDDYADPGTDSGRIMGFAVLGIIALMLILGAIWVISHRGSDPALVADGSTIPAPKIPYKEVPKDPGGKKMAGTGDTSFAVSEGQSRTARLGDGAPSPTVDVEPKAAGAPAVGVQVGAYSTQALAEAAWGKLVQQHSALSGAGHRLVPVQADGGTLYRLQALAPDTAAANALCARIKAGGGSCQVK